jgi:hypothetical protein
MPLCFQKRNKLRIFSRILAQDQDIKNSLEYAHLPPPLNFFEFLSEFSDIETATAIIKITATADPIRGNDSNTIANLRIFSSP